MQLDLFGLIAYLGTIVVGVGGALVAVSLGETALAMAVLTGLIGMLVPTPKISKEGE